MGASHVAYCHDSIGKSLRSAFDDRIAILSVLAGDAFDSAAKIVGHSVHLLRLGASLYMIDPLYWKNGE